MNHNYLPNCNDVYIYSYFNTTSLSSSFAEYFHKHGRAAIVDSGVHLVASSETGLSDRWRGEQGRNLQEKEIANDSNGSTTDGTKFYERPWVR